MFRSAGQLRCRPSPLFGSVRPGSAHQVVGGFPVSDTPTDARPTPSRTLRSSPRPRSLQRLCCALRSCRAVPCCAVLLVCPTSVVGGRGGCCCCLVLRRWEFCAGTRCCAWFVCCTQTVGQLCVLVCDTVRCRNKYKVWWVGTCSRIVRKRTKFPPLRLQGVCVKAAQQTGFGEFIPQWRRPRSNKDFWHNIRPWNTCLC